MAQPVWNTATGSLGTFPPNATIVPIRLSASPVSPATSVTYRLISGSLPAGLTLKENGIILGTPSVVPYNTSTTFVIRATDNLNNIRDRYFSITITGAQAPKFTTPEGNLLNIPDSVWIELPIEFSNPVTDNPVTVRVAQGKLPPGLEINEYGLIRGYPSPPITNVNLATVNTTVTTISDNKLTCFSINGFRPGRPIIFSGSVFGGINENITYFIKEVFSDSSSFTITTVPNGDTYPLTNGTGFMPVSLPTITQGQATSLTYSFTLELFSPLGVDRASYNIIVANQNAPSSLGGLNKPPNTRVPTIYNTRPSTYNIASDDINYSYYILPSNSDGFTYPTDVPAYIGKITSENVFTFKVLGHDFDDNTLRYTFIDLPLGLTGDTVTGWVSGNPIISNDTITEFSFSVYAYKEINPSITTPTITFTFIVTNDIEGNITWITPNDLGTIDNGTVSLLNIKAVSDVSLSYRLVSGSLPPNLVLMSNGEVSGTVAYQPDDILLREGQKISYTFTIEAYSPTFNVVSSTRTFTWTVNIVNMQPTDVLYMKCTPSIEDRELIRMLLTDDNLIPSDYLYRETDPNFGKAKDVVYAHMYGVKSSEFDEYIAAIIENHYWKQITLGEIKTAIARNDDGEIIYEVVYSEIIDNLVNQNGVSISKEVFFPRFIPLNLGPWYTSNTEYFTSYELPDFYTSLTPGFVRGLYPNSLDNMRLQVADVLGQVYNNDTLPKWMTSQQLDGSTTGFVQAWVICYTKPGYAETIKNNIQNNWVDIFGNPYKLNKVNFKIDRFTVDKINTYNYDTIVDPGAWTSYPSARPVPNPADSKNFYTIFPQKTILPNSKN